MSYEGKVFTVVSSQALDEQGFEVLSMGDKDIRELLDKLTYGGSMIVAPSGAYCSDVIKDNKEGIVYAECDLSAEIPLKGIHDISGNYQRCDVYHFGINKEILEPAHIINTPEPEHSRDSYPYVTEEEREKE